jgi:hypothetical protein
VLPLPTATVDESILLLASADAGKRIGLAVVVTIAGSSSPHRIQFITAKIKCRD